MPIKKQILKALFYGFLTVIPIFVCTATLRFVFKSYLMDYPYIVAKLSYILVLPYAIAKNIFFYAPWDTSLILNIIVYWVANILGYGLLWHYVLLLKEKLSNKILHPSREPDLDLKLPKISGKVNPEE